MIKNHHTKEGKLISDPYQNLPIGAIKVLNFLKTYSDQRFTIESILSKSQINIKKGTLSNYLTQLHSLNLVIRDNHGIYTLNKNNINNSYLNINRTLDRDDPSNSMFWDLISFYWDQNVMPTLHGQNLMSDPQPAIVFDKIPFNIEGSSKAKIYRIKDELGITTISIYENKTTNSIPTIRVDYRGDFGNGVKRSLNAVELVEWQIRVEKVFSQYIGSISLDSFYPLQYGIGKDLLYYPQEIEQLIPLKHGGIRQIRHGKVKDTIVEMYMIKDPDSKQNKLRLSIHQNFTTDKTILNQTRPINPASPRGIFKTALALGNIQDIIDEKEELMNQINEDRKLFETNMKLTQKMGQTYVEFKDVVLPKMHERIKNAEDVVVILGNDFSNIQQSINTYQTNLQQSIHMNQTNLKKMETKISDNQQETLLAIEDSQQQLSVVIATEMNGISKSVETNDKQIKSIDLQLKTIRDYITSNQGIIDLNREESIIKDDQFHQIIQNQEENNQNLIKNNKDMIGLIQKVENNTQKNIQNLQSNDQNLISIMQKIDTNAQNAIQNVQSNNQNLIHLVQTINEQNQFTLKNMTENYALLIQRLEIRTRNIFIGVAIGFMIVLLLLIVKNIL